MCKSSLVGVFLAALCLGNRASADEEPAVRVIEKLGGKVTREANTPHKCVIAVDLGTEAEDVAGEKRGGLGGLIGALLVSDESLKQVRCFKSLARLNLSGLNISDAGLTELRGLSELTTLDLRKTGVSDKGLRQLSHLKKLSLLQLQDTKVTEAGVADLQKALPDCKILR